MDASNANAQMWTAFGMRTFSDCYDVYLITEVLLLSDVFESFRDITLQDYCIHPCYFHSLPGFAWNAMLKVTGVLLQLLKNIFQHLFVESGNRGGVVMVFNRQAVANNPLVSDRYERHVLLIHTLHGLKLLLWSSHVGSDILRRLSMALS